MGETIQTNRHRLPTAIPVFPDCARGCNDSLVGQTDGIMTKCRILIADDHDVVRHGIRSILACHPDLEVCGEAGNGREAVGKAEALNPDLSILDISMPGLNGLEATRQILKARENARILILT